MKLLATEERSEKTEIAGNSRRK